MSRLVVLKGTGHGRAGYPILQPDSQSEPVVGVLTRGFAGRLLRLHELLQSFLHRSDRQTPEPAYLLLSENDGGFARSGFYLGDVEKRQTNYVDLVRDQQLVGQFAAMDQIFPHELGHVLMRLLVGERPPGGANQVHAASVRTDPVLAFDEGFAEHLQVMAVDDPEADPATRALAFDAAPKQAAYERLNEYRAEIIVGGVEGSALAGRFPFWFGQTEQCERYYGVRDNLFAYEPAIPDQLLAGPDPYRAYLIESIVPGTPGGARRFPARTAAVEGFVSTFFHRLVTAGCFQSCWEKPGFYDMFGVRPDQVSPLENVYLKVFYAIYSGQTLTLERFVESYCDCFREEASVLRDMLRTLLLDQELRPAPSIWLANPWFQTGTSLFDQYRCVPRIHTFDLNASSLTDLVAVPGIDRNLAQLILDALPVNDLAKLRRLAGMTDDIQKTLLRMAETERVPEEPNAIEANFLQALPDILRSYHRD